MEIKIKAKDLSVHLSEIFGSKDVEPLLLTKISQKTKFHLKKLGNKLIEEQKDVQEQVKSLVAEYYTEEIVINDAEGNPVLNEDGTTKTDKVVPDSKKEDFEKAVYEINELELAVNTYDFKEEDFLDQDTQKIVACKNYINLLDALVFEKEV